MFAMLIFRLFKFKIFSASNKQVIAELTCDLMNRLHDSAISSDLG